MHSIANDTSDPINKSVMSHPSAFATSSHDVLWTTSNSISNNTGDPIKTLFHKGVLNKKLLETVRPLDWTLL